MSKLNWYEEFFAQTKPLTQETVDRLCAKLATESSALGGQTAMAAITHGGKTYKGILFWIEDEDKKEQ